MSQGELAEASGQRRDKSSLVQPEFAMFEALPDLVVVVDRDLNIVYLNPFARRLTGHGEDLFGRSMIDFIHPDDVARAAEVAMLILDDTLGAEVTPAIYRIHRVDETWVPVEVTATTPIRTGSGEERILILGRYSGDTDLRNRIFSMLANGQPGDDIIDVVSEFGTWRHPNAHFAISYPTPDRGWRNVGSPAAVTLLERFRGADAPWELARKGDEIQTEWSALPDALRDAALDQGLHGCMVLPVPVPGSTDVAVAVAWTPIPHQSVNAHRYALEQMASALDVILQWRGHLTELERAARVDPLSGAANRATFMHHFEDALQRSKTTGESVAVLYVDLDNFKAINDDFGHAVGDAVIEAVAGRMGTLVRRSDLVGRIGGDEFAVLCAGVADENEVTRLAERIVHSLAEPIIVGDAHLSVGASIGVTLAHAGIGDPTALLATADRALYQAKSDGRGRWRLASFS